MIEWRHVYSSNAASVGYDQETGAMFVQWVRNGKVSVYEDVPYNIFEKLSKTISVGQMLNTEIKGKYSHRYVK